MIDRLTTTDAPLLRTFLYHAIYVPTGASAPSPAIVDLPELAIYYAGWGRFGDLGFVARLDEQPVGAAWIRLWPGRQKGYGYIADDIPELSIALLPTTRGRGIGTQLLRCLLDAAQADHPAISLSVSDANPARHLYQRFGFQTVAHDGASAIMQWKRPQ